MASAAVDRPAAPLTDSPAVPESHEPLQIAGKRHSAVLIAEEDWRAVQETLYLTGTPGMRDSILKGLRTPVEKCAKELDW